MKERKHNARCPSCPHKAPPRSGLLKDPLLPRHAAYHRYGHNSREYPPYGERNSPIGTTFMITFNVETGFSASEKWATITLINYFIFPARHNKNA